MVTVVFFAWLYLPILAVALFSFNDKKSLSAFSGFSLAGTTTSSTTPPCSTPSWPASRSPRSRRSAPWCSATMLALGLERVRSRRGPAIGAVTLLPLVTPEIVTGVAALLLFTGSGSSSP